MNIGKIFWNKTEKQSSRLDHWSGPAALPGDTKYLSPGFSTWLIKTKGLGIREGVVPLVWTVPPLLYTSRNMALHYTVSIIKR